MPSSTSSLLISITTELVSLSRSGSISAARKLFDEMPERDTIAWNAMLTAYSLCGLPTHSLSLFSHMRFSGTRPDPFSFTGAIAASADLRDLAAGRKLHALVLRSGFGSSLPASNSLVDMYGKCSDPSDAARVFDEMPSPRSAVAWCSLISAHANSRQLGDARQVFDEMPFSAKSTAAWNILITGYARSGEAEKSIGLFKEMLMLGFEGDVFTFVSVMDACSRLPDVPGFGLMIHGFVCRGGWVAAIELSNAVLSFYANLGCFDSAYKIFESMGVRSQVSWNAMLDAHMKAGNVLEALSLFRRSPVKNIISWTSMIAGFARNGQGEEALALFLDMTRSLLLPDHFTFGAVLHASANLAILETGRMIHSCIIRLGFDSHLYVCNGLVNMYAKCGDIHCSSKVFDGILYRDLVSWNAMLFGFALHGLSSSALMVFKGMLSCGVMPDKITYIGLLMACSYAGLVEEGKAFFEMMGYVHGLQVEEDHVTCMVDMLGRAGQLREASELLHTSEASTSSCEALLSSCVIQGDVSMGEKAGEMLVSREDCREAGYVMMSNMYCASGQWKEAERVRRAMVGGGVKKAPGCSWVEVRDMVVAFVAGSQSLVHMVDVHVMLVLLESEIRNPSFAFFNREL